MAGLIGLAALGGCTFGIGWNCDDPNHLRAKVTQHITQKVSQDCKERVNVDQTAICNFTSDNCPGAKITCLNENVSAISCDQNTSQKAAADAAISAAQNLQQGTLGNLFGSQENDINVELNNAVKQISDQVCSDRSNINQFVRMNIDCTKSNRGFYTFMNTVNLEQQCALQAVADAITDSQGDLIQSNKGPNWGDSIKSLCIALAILGVIIAIIIILVLVAKRTGASPPKPAAPAQASAPRVKQ